jgi:hypothetical protein
MLAELISEPHRIILMKFKAEPLDFTNNIVGVSVVQMHRSYLSYLRPAHYDPPLRMIGNVKDEIIFEIAENMFSNFEGLHIIVLLTQMTHLTQIHLLNDRILTVRRPIETNSWNSSLVQFGNVFTATTAQIRQGFYFFPFIEN